MAPLDDPPTISARDAVAQLVTGEPVAVGERLTLRSDTVWSADVMTDDLVTADAQEQILQVALRMIREGIRHIGVVEHSDIIGIVSSRDVFRVFAEDALENR